MEIEIDSGDLLVLVMFLHVPIREVGTSLLISRPKASHTITILVYSYGGSSRVSSLPTSEYCGRHQFGKCKNKMSTYFRCGYGDHFLRDCSKLASTFQTSVRTYSIVQTSVGGHSQQRVYGPVSRDRPSQGRGTAQTEAKQPRLVYTSKHRQDCDELDVIVGTFIIYLVSYYTLSDSGSTHSFVSHTVSVSLDISIENT
ncbi:uncharacterized protein LOC120165044 [Hibiscus syriacus]|uniref:uncharacterized protein LOC120165044 n=1 Tax=Hibiscus syriacus TaxID=106335 RepID=UPI0019233C90|nr:uncharacterized protein LOC120165044 [Hibiscus syriacus]